MFDNKIKPNILLKDNLVIEDLKPNKNDSEYIIINKSYSNFKHKKLFSKSLMLVFNKLGYNNIKKRNTIFNEIEYFLKEYIALKGDLIFIYRKEESDSRQVLFYTTQNLTKNLSLSNNLLFDCSENVKIIILNDKNWNLCSDYIE